MGSTIESLRTQWANPADILSLLLLIGNDIIQKAIAQLVGYSVQLPGSRGRRITVPIVPVAFSFGWVAYGFANLLAAAGQMRLMPNADHPSITVNCANGFTRETRSWALGRLLRDHEIRNPVDQRPVEQGGRADSIRIDIFHLGRISTCSFDLVWWSGLITLALQIIIAIIPLALYGDWGAMLVTVWGVLLVFATCATPQWIDEKWAGRELERQKVTCVTGGNGFAHVMVFVGMPGSWDLESLATGVSKTRGDTRWLSLLLAMLWICLLITISGLDQHTWFLIAIGGLGMLQNVFAAGTCRDPGTSNLHLTPFSKAPTIIGRRVQCCQRPENTHVAESLSLAELEEWLASKTAGQATSTSNVQMPAWLDTMSKENGVPAWLEATHPSHSCEKGHGEAAEIHTIGVQGALIELEKWVPTAGMAMLQVFFPGGLAYNDDSVREERHKNFWKAAYDTASTRKRAVEKQRAQRPGKAETALR